MTKADDVATGSVFKIVAADDWHRACAAGNYMGSDDDSRDGFIHLSAASQIRGTYEKYFRDRNDLLLVAFDTAALGAALKWEPSRGGALFPHYYGALPVRLALWQRKIVESPSGSVEAFEEFA